MSRGLVEHSGIAVPMLTNNIDTDQIIPSREMKRVSKYGLSEGLFAGQRYLSENPEERLPNPDFILNVEPFNQASILLSGENFGCGSSREHAAWAIGEYGFKVIIAQSFGSIFRVNCLRNGILPVTLTAEKISMLHQEVMLNPLNNKVTADVSTKTISSPSGKQFSYELESHYQEMLIAGLDFISLTLKRKKDIDAFIRKDKNDRLWAYLS